MSAFVLSVRRTAAAAGSKQPVDAVTSTMTGTRFASYTAVAVATHVMAGTRISAPHREAEGLDGEHEAARTVIGGNTVATTAIRGESLGELPLQRPLATRSSGHRPTIGSQDCVHATPTLIGELRPWRPVDMTGGHATQDREHQQTDSDFSSARTRRNALRTSSGIRSFTKRTSPTEAIRGNLCCPSRDRQEDFEHDMRKILAQASPSGRFSVRLPDNILRIWRLPA